LNCFFSNQDSVRILYYQRTGGCANRSYAYCELQPQSVSAFPVSAKAPYTNPALSSKVSPFLGTAKAPRILLTAIVRLQKGEATPQAGPSCTSGRCDGNR
jgi:hypothetical protein